MCHPEQRQRVSGSRQSYYRDLISSLSSLCSDIAPPQEESLPNGFPSGSPTVQGKCHEVTKGILGGKMVIERIDSAFHSKPFSVYLKCIE